MPSKAKGVINAVNTGMATRFMGRLTTEVA